MKKIFYFSALLLFSCSESSNAQESLIVDYLETSPGGVKTDLKIDVSSIEVSEITVGDSIAILREKYEQEKLSKTKIAEGAVVAAQKSVDDLTTKIDSNDVSTLQKRMDKIGDETLQRIMQRELNQKKENLQEVQDWQPTYLNRYAGRDESELLVKKAVTTFSHFNPELNTMQERTETFVLSEDGSEVLGIVYKGKLRRKR